MTDYLQLVVDAVLYGVALGGVIALILTALD